MKKHNLKKNITRILACALLVATLGLSLASCTAGDKVKDTAGKAWDTAVDGAKKIYDTAKDKITMEQISGMAAIKLLSDEETVAVPTYAGTLTASDLVDGAWSSTNGKGAVYIQTKYRVGHIASVTGAIMSDYWSSNAGSQPIVAVDGNCSYLCVLLPAGYTDAATWASAASDFSITVTPVIEKMLQATVRPESAKDKSVSWSVSCSDANVNASDYIRLLPGDDNKVTVLALQPFRALEFTIKCTTNVGGYSAECKVTYEGRPEFLDFYLLNEDGSDTCIAGKETFGSGADYKIKMVLGNAFEDVGDNYGIYEVSLKLVGTIKADCIKYNSSGSWLYSTNEAYDISAYASKFASVAVEGNVLTVTVKQAIESFQGDYMGGATAGEYWQFAGYNDTGKPVVEVTVRDTVSGIENTLRFEIRSSVESIFLSDNTLVF